MSLAIFIKSIFIGIGAILPGLSGGALAVVFGLYEKIISSIGDFFKNPKKNFNFLLCVGSGAGLGVVLFSNIQKNLLSRYEAATLLTLLGLLIGTLPGLFKTANKKGFSKKYFISFFITLFIALCFSFIGNNDTILAEKSIDMNFMTIVYLFIIGIVMSASLVIPGISGTVLLMLIGAYGLILTAIADIKNIFLLPFASGSMVESVIENFMILIPLGVGALVGAVIFSKLMDFLLKKFYGFTYYAVLGFIIGSIPELLPKFSFDKSFVVGIFLFFVGLIISLRFNAKYGEA